MANYPEVSGNPTDHGANPGNVGGGAPGTYVSVSNPNDAKPAANATEPGPKLGGGNASAPYRNPTSEMTPVSHPGTPNTPTQGADVTGPNG